MLPTSHNAHTDLSRGSPRQTMRQREDDDEGASNVMYVVMITSKKDTY